MIITRRAATRGPRTTTRAAFTLMEVLVVVAILVILASVGGVAVFKYLDEAKEGKAQLQVHIIEEAVTGYKLTHGGTLPNSLEVLEEKEGNKPAALDTSDVTDPWGNKYQYEPGNTNNKGIPRIYTTSPNGITIANWQPGS